MNIYVKKLVLALAICGMPMGMYADTPSVPEVNAPAVTAEPAVALFNVPILDATRIGSKKQHFDRNATRGKYLEWTAKTVALAWIANQGYGYLFPGVTPVQTESEKNIAALGKQMGVLTETVENMRRESWLDFFGSALSLSAFGITAKNLIKFIASLKVASNVQLLMDLNVDAYWDTVRSEADFAQDIINKAGRLAPDVRRAPLTSLETDYICSMIQDNALRLKKQLEEFIGFVRHKQARDQDIIDPGTSMQIDRRMSYLNTLFDDFAQKLTKILNTTYNSMDKMSADIIECTQQYREEYMLTKAVSESILKS